MQKLSYFDILKLNDDSYGKISEFYHETYKSEVEDKPFDKEFLNSFGSYFSKKSKVLDIGCGSSCQQGCYLYEQFGLQIFGIDISAKAVSLATKKYPHLSLSRMDMSKTDFEDLSFDGLLAFYSLIHIPFDKYSAVFSEWNRLLKPGGYLALTGHLGNQDGIKEYRDHEFYFRSFNENEIDKNLSNHGFKIISRQIRKPMYTGEFEVNRIYYIARKEI
jgi:ubiquinone/menaquinone biosynthesis C-methylase UbiE